MENFANFIVSALNLDNTYQGYDVIAYTFLVAVLILMALTFFKTEEIERASVRSP